MAFVALRPKPWRILLYQLASGAAGVVLMWLVFAWWGMDPAPALPGFAFGWCVASLAQLGHRVEQGTIRAWDGTIAGPGPLFAGRIMTSLDGPPERRESPLDRLNGVWWIKTPTGRIRITKLWYRRADLDRFLLTLGSAA